RASGASMQGSANACTRVGAAGLAAFRQGLRHQGAHRELVIAKVLGRHALDVIGRDGAKLGQQLVFRIQRHALYPVIAQALGLAHDRVALIDIGGHPLRLHALQFGRLDAVPGDLGHFGAQRGLDLGRSLAGGGHARQHEQAGAAAHERHGAARAVGHAAFALDQGPLQAGAVIAVEHGREHQQRQRIAVIGLQIADARQRGRTEGQGHQGLLGRLLDLDAADADLRRLGARLAHRHGACGNAAVVLLGPGADLGNVHITGNDDGGIAGHIPAAVEIAHVAGRQGVQIAHPADHGPVVGRGHEGRRHQLLHEHGARLVLGAHAALFLDDLDLLLELAVGPVVVGEAVGFELHHVFQPAGRNLLVVARVVAAGESVLLAAQGRHPARELAGRHLARALEHH
ncbi:hypothetical protein COLO4_00799, partial [Corchorus olitorius]